MAEETAQTSRAAEATGMASAEPEARKLAVDGVAIRYRFWGQAPATAPGLVFIHGYRAHSRWWDHIAPAFAATHRIAALDFSGFGDSSWREVYSARTFAKEILAVAQHAGLTPAALIAHSFGATPAAHSAAMAPELVSRVVVIDSRMLVPVVPDPSPDELSALRHSNRVYASAEELLSRFRLLPPVDAVEPSVLDHIARHSIRPVEGGWAWKFDARLDPMLSEDPHRLARNGLRPPIDFVYGAKSDVAPPEMARAIARYFGDGEPIFIPEANHHVLLEQPADLIACLKGLLEAAD